MKLHWEVSSISAMVSLLLLQTRFLAGLLTSTWDRTRNCTLLHRFRVILLPVSARLDLLPLPSLLPPPRLYVNCVTLTLLHVGRSLPFLPPSRLGPLLLQPLRQVALSRLTRSMTLPFSSNSSPSSNERTRPLRLQVRLPVQLLLSLTPSSELRSCRPLSSFRTQLLVSAHLLRPLLLRRRNERGTAS